MKLVLVSGARAQTLLQRLPFLPAADAYVCENGGRIFYPHGPLPTALPLQEDMGWRKQLNEWSEPTSSTIVCSEMRLAGLHREPL